MFSERNSALQRLIEIEACIKKVEQSRYYQRLKNGLRTLEGANSGESILTVHSPYDLEKVVKVRRGSKAVEEYISVYREKIRGDSEYINKLNEEKARLEMKLFPKGIRASSRSRKTQTLL